MDTFATGTLVRHPIFGNGMVRAALGETVLVRFGTAIHEVAAHSLSLLTSVEAAVAGGLLADPLEAVLRAQAMTIRSANDRWGVLSRSRVALLPHQLWVCRKVRERWPFRWLVADDVGLGKTIEAGLVIAPLIASGQVRRLLVLTPARLVPQWQARLKAMFDLRIAAFVSEADTKRLDFWAANPRVVASFQTLRDDRAGRKGRLLEAEPWDLVVVDEAHHLNADESSGATLAHDLLNEMDRAGKICSLLFFTGTPHRGKDFGFLSLMQLVRPDLFDPQKPIAEQLPALRQAMIRNNKASVTDLAGRKLFTNLVVTRREHGYSPEETQFYQTMSAFIMDGRAYAESMTGREQSARMLLLIALQKIAASSLAAISSVLRKRAAMLRDEVAAPSPDFSDSVTGGDDEDGEAARQEAVIAKMRVELLRNEVQRIEELLALADAVRSETKIERLLTLIVDDLAADEPVLLFTEYKTTQALIVRALEERFGHGCCAFINGDDALEGVPDVRGRLSRRSQAREAAAEDFNEGRVRFLVSTEAGGEGIDLQQRCATLIHVDLPWNPMRLHQRVGRLWRYGQTRDVTAYILRNPETVESRIWDLLDEKLRRIQRTLSATMADPEDAMQLVLGIANSSALEPLFSAAPHEGDLRGWFDAGSKRLGEESVLDFVRRMLGNVERFDFGRDGSNVPKLDLPDLEAFFLNAVHRHGKRLFRTEQGFELRHTPEAWVDRAPLDIRRSYASLSLDRDLAGRDAAMRVLGVGHALINVAIDEALEFETPLAEVPGLPRPLLILGVEERLTGMARPLARLIFALEDGDEGPVLLRDWQLLKILNDLNVRSRLSATQPDKAPPQAQTTLERLVPAAVADALPLDGEFDRPTIVLEALLLPATSG
ncbi:DEAD/DEAH box helicase [Falsiroseomonas oryzae]|uniref:DEAD/DEAH box helicase n=1 Tax=Falsiroseomonas oryzae TaxID=2766473 RepID=UPI0022EB1718|nr:DEAD/DEAH box helicase [Roseomonas sp. MO-31]